MHLLTYASALSLCAQEDVKGAVEYAQSQIRRLLSGQVELWELPLTGGLWRVTGQEIANVRSCPACYLPPRQALHTSLWHEIRHERSPL